MTMFTLADYIIIAILVLSLLISLVRGFVREALSLVIWAAAFWIAFTFYTTLANLLINLIHTPSLRMITAFGALFLATLVIGALISYLLAQLIDRTGLSGTDRMLGVAFGLARGVLLVAVLIMLAQLTPLQQDPWWKDSVLIPHFQPIEQWLRGLLPQSVNQHLTVSY
jgi:membrane protein required for colicin V production